MSGAGTRLLPMALASIVVTGCATSSPPPKLTADPCTDLKEVVADYPNRFENLRGSRSDYTTMTLYRAKKDIVKGHCEIWEWADGETAYVCSLNAPSEPVAHQRYDQVNQFVASCLGQAWQPETSDRVRDGGIAGVVTRYRNTGHRDFVISVHNVSIPGAPRVPRTNYVYIGSSGRSDAM